MTLIDSYLVGVPAESREQVLVATLKSFWGQHRDRLKLAGDKNNPLAADALSDLNEWKLLGQAVLDEGAIRSSSPGYVYAARLASLNVESCVVQFRYAARSNPMSTVMLPKVTI
jgi:hypothetical protein